jgi:hypothetical protein
MLGAKSGDSTVVDASGGKYLVGRIVSIKKMEDVRDLSR